MTTKETDESWGPMFKGASEKLQAEERVTEVTAAQESATRSIWDGAKHTSYGVGPSTPWGRAYDSYEFAPGILFYATGGHGGFHLSKGRQAEISPALRVDGGWYEEDVEYARVVVGFPSVFDGRWKEDARAALKNWSPDAYEAFFKEEIPEGQSYIKDGRLFKERNRDRFLARATWGDWYEQTPKGFVLVYAEKESTGEKGHFLVPTEEYRGGRPKVGSFIVDEARHERVPDPGLPTTKNIQEVRA